MLNRINSEPVDLQDRVAGEQSVRRSDFAVLYRPRPAGQRKKTIWIDLDNSPHVPFFLPIIEELEKAGIEVVLTARNMYQTCELLKFFHLECKVVGGHYGRNKLTKVLCNCIRATQLLPWALSHGHDLAVSHGSRAQILVSKLLRIPTLMMHDYEYSTKTGFVEPDWLLMPSVIPGALMSKKMERVLKYPGLKEDVYVPRFKPDPSILKQLGICSDHLVVILRPPAQDSHYHTPETEKLFSETLTFLADIPHLRAITLPRNGRQSRRLHSDCADLIAAGRMVIPDTPVDGLNLMWFSDLVISGGGTMNREAAALGVPVYSIFRGKIGAVDQYLADEGRLVLIQDSRDLRGKIALARWKRPAYPDITGRSALRSIVDNILAIANTKYPASSSAAVNSHAGTSAAHWALPSFQREPTNAFDDHRFAPVDTGNSRSND